MALKMVSNFLMQATWATLEAFNGFGASVAPALGMRLDPLTGQSLGLDDLFASHLLHDDLLAAPCPPVPMDCGEV